MFRGNLPGVNRPEEGPRKGDPGAPAHSYGAKRTSHSCTIAEASLPSVTASIPRKRRYGSCPSIRCRLEQLEQQSLVRTGQPVAQDEPLGRRRLHLGSERRLHQPRQPARCVQGRAGGRAADAMAGRHRLLEQADGVARRGRRRACTSRAAHPRPERQVRGRGRPVGDDDRRRAAAGGARDRAGAPAARGRRGRRGAVARRGRCGARQGPLHGTCAHCHGPNAVVAESKINLRLLKRKYGEQMEEVFLSTVTNGRRPRACRPGRTCSSPRTSPTSSAG